MTQAPIQKTMAASDWALLVVLSIVWGGSFLFIGVAVRELPPLTIVAVRVVTAALALLVTLMLVGLALPRDPSGLGGLLGHVDPQQCDPLHADRLGTEPYRQRVGLDSQCHDAALHSDRGALPDGRRAPHGAEIRRRHRGLRRRCGDDRRRRFRFSGHEHPGTAGHSRRGPVLRLFRCVRAALQDHGHSAACDGRRAGDGLERASAAGSPPHRSALDIGDAWYRDHRVARGPRPRLDGLRLSDLLPPAGAGRGHECRSA